LNPVDIIVALSFLPVLLPRGGARVRWQEIRVQPEKPASEAAGDLSGNLSAGGMDLHPVLRSWPDRDLDSMRNSRGDIQMVEAYCLTPWWECILE